MTAEASSVPTSIHELQDLLTTLSKVSMARILSFGALEVTGDFYQIKIPVKYPDPDDNKDSILRKFAVDWLKRRSEAPIGASSKFETLGRAISWHEKGTEYPVKAAIILCWWPKDA